MTWIGSGCFVTLAILFIWRVADLAEACSCAPKHPQQAFCDSDVVIRAKVLAANKVDVGNDVYGNPTKLLKYDIELVTMFKGPSEKIDAIYTPPISALCGLNLEVEGQMEYLITGKVEKDGIVYVTLCDFIEPWQSMSAIQQANLNQIYEMGCDCKITHCMSIPCMLNSEKECLWTDFFVDNNNGTQAKSFSCIQRTDGSCAWYWGSSPPEKDFLDIEEP
ncbi:Metalloproteinase inhibitor 2 [Merluccius polli]|uniref:Metalloproteinase inhibitor 2 n=1 Tax=Merluccius polli TaxID=89951 RepID=A0AA47MCN9_MERPO|nr:Metalloproteinase inhibitor 2 [Merluccius polli]